MESSSKLGSVAHVFGVFTHFQKRHKAFILDAVNKQALYECDL